MDGKAAKPKKRGPKPETVAVKEDWEKAVSKALKRTRPAEGWPKHHKAGPTGQTKK